MKELVLYHGSTDIIEAPEFGKGKAYNDYGQGFYCTENKELAKEWACLEGIDGYVNQYRIDLDSINILNLSSKDYSILHWLTILTENRKIRISTPAMRRGVEWLQANFHIDITAYDAVIGYRADDSYFSFARSFLTNQISIAQLAYAMKLGKLGEQYVLKSPKAFESIRFLDYVVADNSIYYAKRKARDDAARADFQRELEKEDIDGIFMRDILREEMKQDDPRLR